MIAFHLRAMMLSASLLMSAGHAASGSYALQFLTHELPPLNFTEKGETLGLCSDLVRELQKRTNTTAPLIVVPWARGYQLAIKLPNTALFFTTRTNEREALFHWVGPIVNVSSNFYAKVGSSLKITSLADAARVKNIIVHRGSHLEKTLIKRGLNNLIAMDTPEDAVRALLRMGDDEALLLLTAPSVPSLLQKRGLAVDAIKPVYLAHKSQGYIAISKSTDPEVVNKLQNALDDMKRDGSFAAIYGKWLPDEKPPTLKSEAEMDMLQLRK